MQLWPVKEFTDLLILDVSPDADIKELWFLLQINNISC